MATLSRAELLLGHSKLPVDVNRHLTGSTPVLLVPDEFLAEVSRDPDVQDWLISC